MKRCPKCGKDLDKFSFKCIHCGSWLDNEVFEKLKEKDVCIIKDQNLLMCTPSLFALMLSTIIFKEEFKTTRLNISNDLFLINNLLFKSYVLFHWSYFFTKKKHNKNKIIYNSLKKSIIEYMSDQLSRKLNKSISFDEATKKGKFLFHEFDNLLSRLDLNIPSQTNTSIDLANIVYNESDIEKGFELYQYYTMAFGSFQDIFSNIFLLEEEDWDWQNIV